MIINRYWLLLFIFLPLLVQGQDLNYLFKSGSGGYHTYRIPTIVQTKNGALLAFAEGRKHSWNDSGDIDIVMRKSTDGGKTWSEMKKIWDDGNNTCGNPSALVDRKTGKVFVFSTWNLGTDYEYSIIDGKSKDTRRVYVLESSDEGNTWSAPKEITEAVKRKDWTWYATGPVHGIQIQKGKYKGRLVMPCDHIERMSKRYYSHVFYSDDHGKTWQLGGSTPTDKVNECTVAELSNGNLMLNMRNYDRKVRARKIAISTDGGETWGALHTDTALIEPICQGALLRFSFGRKKRNILLFSNPEDSKKRINYTVKMSHDDGKTWTRKISLFKGCSGYSDMVKIDKSTIGCLFEGGYDNLADGIIFETVKIRDFKTD